MPTKCLLAASAIWPLAAGLAWAIIAWPIGGADTAILGPISAVIVAGTSMGCNGLIRPWKKRTTLQWMNLWILHEAGRITTSLGVLILLYFAFSPSPTAFLFSYLLCAMATLLAITRIWTKAMRDGNEVGQAAVQAHHQPGNA
jgi:uncharacterized membrane protein HdeD (DUF308 family)